MYDKERFWDIVSRKDSIWDEIDPDIIGKLDAAMLRNFFPSLSPKNYVLENLVERLLPPLQSILDSGEDIKALVLGSGSGISAILLSEYFGMTTYGIDANPEAIGISSIFFKRMNSEGLLENGPPQVYLGNFFPQDFEIDSDPDVERKARWDDLEEVPDYLWQADPYQEMGFSIADFDVVFFYQYNRNHSAIMKYVSERCRPGTLVIHVLSGPQQLTLPVPENLEQTASHDYFRLFRVNELSTTMN